MLNSPLWKCPVCQFDGQEPSCYCKRCGCHLLRLVKIKLEAQLSMIRAEMAKGACLYQAPLHSSASLLQRLRSLFHK